jgi:hypothetical protein
MKITNMNRRSTNRRSTMKRNSENLHPDSTRISFQNQFKDSNTVQSLNILRLHPNFQNKTAHRSSRVSIDNREIAKLTIALAMDDENYWKHELHQLLTMEKNNSWMKNHIVRWQGSFKEKYLAFYFYNIIRLSSSDLDLVMGVAEVAGTYIKIYNIENVARHLSDDVYRTLMFMPNLEEFRVKILNCSQVFHEIDDESSNDDSDSQGLNYQTAELIQMHSRFMNLHTVIIESSALKPASLKILLNSFRSSFNIKSLSLANNRISDEGVYMLQSFLISHQNVKIQKLNLSDNEISNEGNAMIAEWIGKANCPLTHVDLSTNFINNNGFIKLLFKILENSDSKLRTLDLKNNFLRDDLGEVLSVFVNQNQTLKKLLLDGNDIYLTSTFARALEMALESQDILNELSLKYNQIDEDTLERLKQNY